MPSSLRLVMFKPSISPKHIPLAGARKMGSETIADLPVLLSPLWGSERRYGNSNEGRQTPLVMEGHAGCGRGGIAEGSACFVERDSSFEFFAQLLVILLGRKKQSTPCGSSSQREAA